MPATYDANVALSRARRRLVDHDRDSNSIQFVRLGRSAASQCLPIRDFRRFVAGLFHSVGTGGVTKFQIVAATSAAGAGVQIVKDHDIGSNPNAVGDTLWLEVDAEQVREVLSAATHVGVRVTQAVATDEFVVSFEECDPFYEFGTLTEDHVA